MSQLGNIFGIIAMLFAIYCLFRIIMEIFRIIMGIFLWIIDKLTISKGKSKLKQFNYNHKDKVSSVSAYPEPSVAEPDQTYFTTDPPAIPDIIPDPFDYQDDWWKEYSYWYREQKGWQCEVCKLLLIDHRHLLHTHHVWGTKHNDPKDLMALCIGCHSEQPGYHRELKNTNDYQHFISRYGKKWQMLRNA